MMKVLYFDRSGFCIWTKASMHKPVRLFPSDVGQPAMAASFMTG